MRRLLQRALSANRPMTSALFRVVLAAGLALAAVAPHLAHAQSTGVWYRSIDGTSSGLVTDFPRPTSTAAGLSMMIGFVPSNVSVAVRAPQGETLHVGSYETASNTIGTTGPVIDFEPGSNFCLSSGTGHLWVSEVTFAADGTIASLAADFEFDCPSGYGVPNSYVEVRFNSGVPFSANRSPGWTTPDPITIPPAGPIPAGMQAVSSRVHIYGINAPAPISIANGEYSINGGAFTTAAGTINNHDSVAVRTTAQPGVASTDATLAIGGLATRFRLATYAPGDAFTAYNVYNIDGTSSTMEAWDAAASMGGFGSANSLRIAWGTDVDTAVDMSFEGGQSGILAPGAYELTSSTSYSSTAPLITLDYHNMVCDGPGRFVVLDYAVDSDDHLLRLAIDFEHGSCYAAKPVFGEIRYNTTVPLSRFKPQGAPPDEFRLLAQNPMKAGDLAVSNPISVMGTTQMQPISIASGEYSVNGGAYTSAAGMVQPHDRITVRAHAPAADGATASATLNLGGVARDLSLTAYAPGTTMSGLYLSTLGLMLAPMNAVRAQYGSIVVSPLVGDDLTVSVGVRSATPAPTARAARAACTCATPRTT